MDHSPIFIHSLHRCGSTWLFQVFRRAAANYWCYAEPAHQVVASLLPTGQLLSIGQSLATTLRHGELERPYYWELVQVQAQIIGLVNEAISYKNYFAPHRLCEQDRQYFAALIAAAPYRPVLQFCRSAGRAHALKEAFGGLHVHLWREPRSQWWSMKVDQYFDDAIQLIYNSPNLPPALAWVRKRVRLCRVKLNSVQSDVEKVRSEALSREEAYLAFYALWLYANVHLRRIADIEFSIDRASLDVDYRARVASDLSDAGVGGICMDDCRIPMVSLQPAEIGWYAAIEQKVHDNMLRSESARDLDVVSHELQLIRSLELPEHNLADELRRQRELTLRMIEAFQYTYRNYFHLRNAS